MFTVALGPVIVAEGERLEMLNENSVNLRGV